MVILQISAALGPLECSLAVLKILKIMLKEADNFKIKYEFLNLQTQEGEVKSEDIFEVLKLAHKKTEKLPKSLILSLEAQNSILEDKFVSMWEGSIQWICPSPFRIGHKRKNWFIGIKKLQKPEQQNTILEKDLKYETMKASGAGGQHINKTNSAVRLIHIPTGLTVKVESFRSQQQNRKLALILLYAKLEETNIITLNEAQKTQNQHHHEILRGNPKRIFKGMDCVEL